MTFNTKEFNTLSSLSQSEQEDLKNLVQNEMIGYVMLGKRTSANMNTTSDQTITINSVNYVIRRILVTNASVSLTTAAGGVYTSTAKGGTAIVAAAQAYSSLNTNTKVLDLTIANTERRTAGTIYLSLTTGQGSAATADFYVYGEKLD